jgi:hypothetical protein
VNQLNRLKLLLASAKEAHALGGRFSP